MIKRPFQRVAVFIDTQNMYHSARHLFNTRVNFGAVVEAAAGNRQLIRAIAYVAKSKTGEEEAFFDALVKSGIELKIKDVQEFSSGAKKADWDVGMAVDAMAISTRVDAVVLVTGDGDFVPLVQHFKANGILAEVMAFEESTNAQLREAVDLFTNLSAEPERYLLGFRGRHRPIGRVEHEPVMLPSQVAPVLPDEENELLSALLEVEASGKKKAKRPAGRSRRALPPKEDTGPRPYKVTF
jgi:uncharacterized LabA/DUF88 family protein